MITAMILLILAIATTAGLINLGLIGTALAPFAAIMGAIGGLAAIQNVIGTFTGIIQNISSLF